MNNQNGTRQGIPLNAHRAFKGVIFEVWQWEQEMFDGTFAIFEKVWRLPTVEVIAEVNGKIMITKQSQPGSASFLSLAGGRVDEGEDMRDAAARELREETGYSSEDWAVLHESEGSGKVVHPRSIFIARRCVKRTEPHLDAGEQIEVEFVSFDDFLTLLQSPDFRVFPEVVEMAARAVTDPTKKAELYKVIFG